MVDVEVEVVVGVVVGVVLNKTRRNKMKTIIISEETYNLIKDQLGEEEKIDVNNYKDLVGKKLFFRTVTYHLVGKVEKVMGNFLELSTASWVADSGRFMQAIENGELKEVEPMKSTVWVNINTITDMCIWKHSLDIGQK